MVCRSYSVMVFHREERLWIGKETHGNDARTPKGQRTEDLVPGRSESLLVLLGGSQDTGWGSK